MIDRRYSIVPLPRRLTDDLNQFRLLAAHLSGGTSNCEIKDMVINIFKEHGIKGRILDFGAGKGELVSLLAQMDGMELHGADIMERPENIPAYVNWYQQDLNDALMCDPASFDAVICSEVIEHLGESANGIQESICSFEAWGKAGADDAESRERAFFLDPDLSRPIRLVSRG